MTIKRLSAKIELKKYKVKTVYVTSVSGPKQYKQDAGKFNEYFKQNYQLDKSGQQIQFYQVITIEQNKLTYIAYTATGEEYDSFEIIKNFETGKKKLNFIPKNEKTD